MSSFEESFAATDTCPDERAAGVISGSDPYRELELYLEKVNEEIGEVFEKWNNLSATRILPIKPRYEQIISSKNTEDKKYCTVGINDALIDKKSGFSFSKQCSSLPSRKDRRSFETCLEIWSKSLLAEFNTIIQNGTPPNTVESLDADYDEVAGDSDDDSVKMKYCSGQRDNFEILTSSSPTISPSTSEHSSSGSTGSDNTRRTPPYLSRMGFGKQRSVVANVNESCDSMLVNVEIGAAERSEIPEVHTADHEFENSHHTYVPYKYYLSQIHSKGRYAVVDMGTQTSPTESRSSSFTWISDCSEDDHSSTTSSTEDSRRLGDSSSDCTPTKDEPESGIGTASPPRHSKYNKSSNAQKFGRKEIWETLRRRQDGKLESATRKFISSHSVADHHSGTMTSSDPDLTIFRTPRPTCLQLASSSLSPESSRETLPSPSATSLTLGLEPSYVMNRELGGKSSSAPLLIKHGISSNRCGNIRKVPRQSKFHSEKLLIVPSLHDYASTTRSAVTLSNKMMKMNRPIRFDYSFYREFEDSANVLIPSDKASALHDHPLIVSKPMYFFRTKSRAPKSNFQFVIKDQYQAKCNLKRRVLVNPLEMDVTVLPTKMFHASPMKNTESTVERPILGNFSSTMTFRPVPVSKHDSSNSVVAAKKSSIIDSWQTKNDVTEIKIPFSFRRDEIRRKKRSNIKNKPMAKLPTPKEMVVPPLYFFKTTIPDLELFTAEVTQSVSMEKNLLAKLANAFTGAESYLTTISVHELMKKQFVAPDSDFSESTNAISEGDRETKYAEKSPTQLAVSLSSQMNTSTSLSSVEVNSSTYIPRSTSNLSTITERTVNITGISRTQDPLTWTSQYTINTTVINLSTSSRTPPMSGPTISSSATKYTSVVDLNTNSTNGSIIPSFTSTNTGDFSNSSASPLTESMGNLSTVVPGFTTLEASSVTRYGNSVFRSPSPSSLTVTRVFTSSTWSMPTSSNDAEIFESNTISSRRFANTSNRINLGKVLSHTESVTSKQTTESQKTTRLIRGQKTNMDDGGFSIGDLFASFQLSTPAASFILLLALILMYVLFKVFGIENIFLD